MSSDLKQILEETTVALGATDETFISFLQYVNKEGKFSMPSRLFQGQLVFFKYKPKSESFISRNTYYDQFPLVLITDVYRGGFEGINVHFIDSFHRQFLFDSIMRNLPVIKAGEEWRNRMKIDYDRLQARRMFKFFRPCYRKYVWKGMIRRPALVPFDCWEEMVMANTFKFVGARPVTVFRESRNQVLRRGR